MEAVSVDEGGTAPGEQIMQTTVALEGDGTVIAQARHLATQFLTRAQTERGVLVSQRAVDLTQLVVSELVTNPRKYAPGPVLMDLRITGETVEIVVWDSDPELPIARAADTGRVGQHGLEIVLAVAQGFEAQREPVGKRITARLALLDIPDRAIAGQ
ncbi:ATP-binding protein [Streptomyces sp. NPDC051315]|uniref:ATP-binding protein n=1 Tax=Streptomyces sp. NPDC051315 TaxID=3365650 RepID=UPI003787AFA4